MLIPLVRPPDVGFAEFRFDLAPPPHPHAVAAVRHLLRDALAVIGLNSDAPCSLLTELLTNAIRHGGAPSVILDLYDGQLFIVVTDPSTRRPTVQVENGQEESGRGMALVQALADEWGVEEIGQRGKAVWALIAAA
ncbi:ATP-binding protein [Kitasatospora sp. NBC_00070]|uniref:ATP-binding protein n=1 Tax=Kitasatospora sp. NBC_00070 TaxID=2975962 RepID=UPI00324E7C36